MKRRLLLCVIPFRAILNRLQKDSESEVEETASCKRPVTTRLHVENISDNVLYNLKLWLMIKHCCEAKKLRPEFSKPREALNNSGSQ
jgi:hypothetical protein